MDINTDLLKKSLIKEGFLLEEVTRSTFENNGFKVDSNLDYKRQDPHDSSVVYNTELDILASFNGDDSSENIKYFCECKKRDSSNVLILLKDKHGGPKKIPSFWFTSHQTPQSIIIKHDDYLTLAQGRSPEYCLRGDFFHYTNENSGYVKSGGNTNLHKASQQLFHGIEGHFYDRWENNFPSGDFFEIIPTIVTNTTLIVAEYNTDPNNLVNLKTVPWTICSNRIHYNGYSKMNSFNWGRNNKDNKIYQDNRYFPHFWVVNSYHLEQFISDNQRKYPEGTTILLT